MSSNTKRMIASVGIGCAAGLAAGAVVDEVNRKKDSKDKKNDMQRQVKSMLLMERKKPQNKGKIIGLGVGCLAGLGAGFYLNSMHDEMSEELGKEGIALEKSTDKSGETQALVAKMD